MSEVWASNVKGDSRVGNKPGTCFKYYNHDWTEPTFVMALTPKDVRADMERHNRGETLKRHELPEAASVWNEKAFSRQKDFFYGGVGFMAVKGRLAEILLTMDLGEGGLVPFPIYKADKTTPIDEACYLINFGCIKNSYLPHQSEKAEQRRTIEKHGFELWNNHYAKDGDIAVSPAALNGPDLWYDAKLRTQFFLSERLAHAILDAKIKPNLSLIKCRIVEGA